MQIDRDAYMKWKEAPMALEDPRALQEGLKLTAPLPFARSYSA